MDESTALIIENDPDVALLLESVLTSIGLHVVVVHDMDAAVAAVRTHRPVLTTLGVETLDHDGLEAARRIRQSGDTYLVLLAPSAEQADAVRALEAGADDFMAGPLRSRELSARVEALLRRPRSVAQSTDEATPPAPTAQPAAEPSAPRSTARNPSADAGLPSGVVEGDRWLTHRDLTVNLDTREVLVAQQEVVLPDEEFVLLATLMQSRRRVRSTSDLALVLRGEPLGEWYEVDDAETERVDERIASLRRRIGDTPEGTRYIGSDHGSGYRLTPSDSDG